MPAENNSPKERQGSVLQRGGISLIGAGLGGILVIINEILVARFLGIEVYGLYALAFAAAKMGQFISIFGLQTSVLHFIPIYSSKGEENRVLGTIVAAIVLPTVIGGGLIAFIWSFTDWLSLDILNKPGVQSYLTLFALSIPLLALSEILGSITRALGYTVYYVLIVNLVPPIVYFLLLLILMLTQAAPLLVAVGYCSAYLIAFLLGLFFLKRALGPSRLKERPKYDFSTLYLYSVPLALNALFYIVFTFTDIFMLGVMKESQDVGVYRGCLQLTTVFQMIIVALNAGAANLFSVMAAEKRTDELAKTYGIMIRWTAYLAAAAFIIIALNRTDLLSLFGDEFTVAEHVLLLLLVAHLLRSCLGGTGFVLVVTGHQKIESFNAILGAVLNVVLNLWLIPDYGILGAAIATSFAHLLLNLLRVIQIYRYLGLHTVQLFLLRVFLVTGAIYLLGSLLSGVLGIDDGAGALYLFIRLPLTALLISIGLWFFGLGSEDRAIVHKGLHALQGRKS